MNRNWTRDEVLVALNTYCKIPFKDSRASHPLVMEMAHLIGRTPAALNLKIGNLGRFDPELQRRGIVGLRNGAKIDEEIWNEFTANPEKLAIESEQIIARLKNAPLEQEMEFENSVFPIGEDKSVVVRQRVGQRFFRDAVLSSYGNKCCVSGVSNSALIDACHISSWKTDIVNRTNPSNGLCLNAFFHRAYDNYLFSVSPDYKISIADQLIDATTNLNSQTYLRQLDGQAIMLPEKFLPSKDLLAIHHYEYQQTIL